VGSASTNIKGNVSRSLAAKASLAVRVDAFSKIEDGEDDSGSNCKLGLEMKAKIESRLKHLENKGQEDPNKKKFAMKKDGNDLKRKRENDDEKRDNPRKIGK